MTEAVNRPHTWVPIVQGDWRQQTIIGTKPCLYCGKPYPESIASQRPEDMICPGKKP